MVYHPDPTARQRFSQPVRRGTRPRRASARVSATPQPSPAPRSDRPTIPRSLRPPRPRSNRDGQPLSGPVQLPRPEAAIRRLPVTLILLLPTTATGDRVLAVQRVNAQPRPLGINHLVQGVGRLRPAPGASVRLRGASRALRVTAWPAATADPPTAAGSLLRQGQRLTVVTRDAVGSARVGASPRKGDPRNPAGSTLERE